MQRILQLGLSVGLMLILSSCTEDLLVDTPIPTGPPPEQHAYYEALASMGIHPSSLEEKGDYILVDNDMVFETAHLLQRKESSFDKAIVLTDVVSYQNVKNIDYYITPWSFTNAQKVLIQDATEQWENISDCAINFNRLKSIVNADLVITKQTYLGLPQALQDASANGVAWFPQNGAVGYWIAIATQNNAVQQATDDEFRLLVQHEIGHTLGYTHSNFALSVPLGTIGQSGNFQKIILPCTLETETGNLMDGSGSGNLSTLNELSDDEKLAAHKLYPGHYSGPQITSHNVLYSGANRYIKFTMNTGSDYPVKVKVERYHPWITSSPAGVSGTLLLEGCGNTGRHVTVQTPTGYWNYRIKLGNFEGDYFGSPSAPYGINVN